MPVYFVRAADNTGPVKIGWAKDPAKRLAALQRMSPVKLAILNTVEGDRRHEAALHRRFAALRLYGEWFKPTANLLRFIASPRPIKPKPTTPKMPPKGFNADGLLVDWEAAPVFCTPRWIKDTLNIPQTFIYQAIKGGRLKAEKDGGTWLIRPGDLQTFIEGL